MRFALVIADDDLPERLSPEGDAPRHVTHQGFEVNIGMLGAGNNGWRRRLGLVVKQVSAPVAARNSEFSARKRFDAFTCHHMVEIPT